MKTKMTMLAAAGATMLAMCANPAAAANLVANAGFETGTFAGWTQGGNMGATYVANSPNVAHTGSYAAQLGPVAVLGTLSQTLATVSGQAYDVSFWFENAAGSTPNSLSLSWNGTSLFSRNNITSRTWQQATAQVIGTGSDTLTFSFFDDPSYLGLDDVSVSAVAAVPEPSAWGMMILGLGAIGVATRRRRTVKTTVAYA